MSTQTKVTYITIVLLILSNLYWIVDKYRTNNSINYEGTYTCELEEYNYCLQNFSIGMTLYDFRNQIKAKNLNFFMGWKHKNKEIIKLSDIDYECPE